MHKKLIRIIKLLIVLLIIGLFVWFLVLSPMITFRNNERKFEEAARRYYELYSDELPTGERVKTLSLNTLYKKSFLKEDFLVPYSNQVCSLEDSWVKVKKVNNVYNYYVFLDCGMISSSIDHTGPQIKLKGDTEIVIGLDEEFTDPGVDSVVDNVDKSMNIDVVSIKGKVDTSKVGSYEITYTARDSLYNISSVTRTVTVVKKINSIVKKDLGDKKNYVGNPNNNYVRLSNMYFRIFGLDENENIILVAEEDVANVNYSKIEKWLDEVYLNHFTDEAKKLLVETKFCTGEVTNFKTVDCESYTKKRYVYIPSIADVNLAQDGFENFMKPYTFSWVSNTKDESSAYIAENFTLLGDSTSTFDVNDNYGVRPKLVIKGDTLIVGGDGTQDKPYVFGETKKAKGGTYLNQRYTGEYVVADGYLFRIIEVENDGTTKIISDDTLGDLNDRPMTTSNVEEDTILYDIKNKKNYAYFINNKASKYIDVSLFEIHEFNAPVYKDKIIYGEEEKVNTFKVRLAAPDMYDMFSAQVNRVYHSSHSFWLINTSSSKKRIAGVVMDYGVPINDSILDYEKFGIRVSGYVSSKTIVVSGDGTYNNPYRLG